MTIEEIKNGIRFEVNPKGKDFDVTQAGTTVVTGKFTCRVLFEVLNEDYEQFKDKIKKDIADHIVNHLFSDRREEFFEATKELMEIPPGDYRRLQENISRIIDMASKLPPPSQIQWQPIDTAPRDGTAILVYVACVITTAEWKKWEENGRDNGYWDLCESGTFAEDGICYPTHWMPLPERPTK